MKLSKKATIWALLISISSEVALACSACIKDILEPEEFDRRAWENSDHIFIGRVRSTELVRLPDGQVEVLYSLKVIETFKGDPEKVSKVLSTGATLPDPNAIKCGTLSIDRGDRLLIFSNPTNEAILGLCSPSRVIRGESEVSREERRNTLRRLRSW